MTTEIQVRESAAKLQFERGDTAGALLAVESILAEQPLSPSGMLAFKIHRNNLDIAAARTLRQWLQEHGALRAGHHEEVALIAYQAGDVRSWEAELQVLRSEAGEGSDREAALLRRAHSFRALPGGRLPPPHDQGTPVVHRQHDGQERLERSLERYGPEGFIAEFKAQTASEKVPPVSARLHACFRAAARKDPDAAMEGLAIYLDCGLDRASYVYQAVLVGLVLQNRFDAARAVHRQAIESGDSSPHVTRTVIEGLARTGATEEALSIAAAGAERGESPEILIGTDLAARLFPDADLDEIQAILQPLADAGDAPSPEVLTLLWHHSNPVVREFARCTWEEPDFRTVNATQRTDHLLTLSDDIRTVDEAVKVLSDESAADELGQHNCAELDLHVLRTYGKSDCPEKAQEYSERMLANGRPPDGLHLHVLMASWAAQSNVERVEQCFGDLLEGGFAVSGYHLAALVTAYSKAGFPDKAETMLENWAPTGFVPDQRHHLGPIIAAYRRLHRPSDAQRLIDGLGVSGVEPDGHNLSEAMRAWADHGDPQKVFTMFHQFVEQGGTPDGYHYGPLLQVCYQQGDIPRALGLLNDMRSVGLPPGPVHYNQVMEIGLKLGDHEHVRTMFDRLLEEGGSVDSYVVATLIENEISALDIDGLQRVEELLQAEPHLADSHTVGSLIRGYDLLRQHDIAESAYERFREVLAAGVGELRVLRRLARGSAHAGDQEGTLRYLGRLETLSDRTSEDTLTELVLAASLGKRDEALLSYTELDDLTQLSAPDLAVLASSLAANGFPEEAETAIGQLAAAAELRPKQVGHLLDAWTKAGNAPRAENAFRQYFPEISCLPEDETYLYNLLLRAHSWASSPDDVQRITDEMLARGLNLDRFSIGTLQAALHREGAFDAPENQIRDEDAGDWQELTLLLDDVVHELSQWVGALGGLINATSTLESVSEDDLLEYRLLQMGGIVNDISERLGEYSAVANLEPGRGLVNIADIVDWSVKRVAPEADRAGIEILVGGANLSGNRQLEVRGNPYFLRLAVKALLNNAIDALATHTAPPGDRRIWINALETSVPGGAAWVDLFVRDNGPGIPAHERERVFERGFSTKRQRGLGLGLSLVSTVAEALAGTVSVTRDGVGGAEFWLRLPLLQTEVPDE